MGLDLFGLNLFGEPPFRLFGGDSPQIRAQAQEFSGQLLRLLVLPLLLCLQEGGAHLHLPPQLRPGEDEGIHGLPHGHAVALHEGVDLPLVEGGFEHPLEIARGIAHFRPLPLEEGADGSARKLHFSPLPSSVHEAGGKVPEGVCRRQVAPGVQNFIRRRSPVSQSFDPLSQLKAYRRGRKGPESLEGAGSFGVHRPHRLPERQALFLAKPPQRRGEAGGKRADQDEVLFPFQALLRAAQKGPFDFHALPGQVQPLFQDPFGSLPLFEGAYAGLGPRQVRHAPTVGSRPYLQAVHTDFFILFPRPRPRLRNT